MISRNGVSGPSDDAGRTGKITVSLQDNIDDKHLLIEGTASSGFYITICPDGGNFFSRKDSKEYIQWLNSLPDKMRKLTSIIKESGSKINSLEFDVSKIKQDKRDKLFLVIDKIVNASHDVKSLEMSGLKNDTDITRFLSCSRDLIIDPRNSILSANYGSLGVDVSGSFIINNNKKYAITDKQKGVASKFIKKSSNINGGISFLGVPNISKLDMHTKMMPMWQGIYTKKAEEDKKSEIMRTFVPPIVFKDCEFNSSEADGSAVEPLVQALKSSQDQFVGQTKFPIGLSLTLEDVKIKGVKNKNKSNATSYKELLYSGLSNLKILSSLSLIGEKDLGHHELSNIATLVNLKHLNRLDLNRSAISMSKLYVTTGMDKLVYAIQDSNTLCEINLSENKIFSYPPSLVKIFSKIPRKVGAVSLGLSKCNLSSDNLKNLQSNLFDLEGDSQSNKGIPYIGRIDLHGNKFSLASCSNFVFSSSLNGLKILDLSDTISPEDISTMDQNKYVIRVGEMILALRGSTEYTSLKLDKAFNNESISDLAKDGFYESLKNNKHLVEFNGPKNQQLQDHIDSNCARIKAFNNKLIKLYKVFIVL